ncbi:DUF2202 domain-containing protein [Celerinatantimonas sp. YJH-8]|uniref:DUF2202 domain-containing protein n=1 Tax=Celerinatantimonas sp. YJH-8 TaxID=3228714 RepID=UPI0038C73ABC
MKRFYFTLMLTLLTLIHPGQATEFGAAAAKLNSSPNIEQMLTYAIQDEYLARAEYRLILQKYGNIKPFSNIINAENQHIKRLSQIFTQRGLTLPADTATEHVILPQSLKAAMQTGVQAEIDNIAMYQAFLENPLLNQKGNTDVQSVFKALMNASEKHLSAFKRGLNRTN